MLAGLCICAALCIMTCLIIAACTDIRAFLPTTSRPPKSLNGRLLICTVCSEGSGVPSAPVTFAARFSASEFITASAPLCLGEPPPPPQRGTYRFSASSRRDAQLKMKQLDKGVASTLKLRFTHESGGTLIGDMTKDGECIAEQCGVFQLCRILESET